MSDTFRCRECAKVCTSEQASEKDCAICASCAGEEPCSNCEGENAKTGHVELWDGVCPECGRNVPEDQSKVAAAVRQLCEEYDVVTKEMIAERAGVSVEDCEARLCQLKREGVVYCPKHNQHKVARG